MNDVTHPICLPVVLGQWPSLPMLCTPPSPLTTPPPPPSATTLAEIDEFKALLFRDTNKQQVENKCRQLLQQYANDYPALYAFFKVIRYSRETLLERDLMYLQICVWYETLPHWAMHALSECVYGYGCWKDIKYLCHFCKTKHKTEQHPLILYAICLLDYQLKQDWAALQSHGLHISNAAKWTPREKSKHGWIHTLLSVGYFGYLSAAVTLEQHTKALNKSKMSLRKILSSLNKHLDTVEIKQCSNHWDNIRHIPKHATFKYHRAWVRHSVEVSFHHHDADFVPQHYPFANLKTVADRLNHEYELDKEVLREPIPEYRDNLNRLVEKFFGIVSGRALSILDLATLGPHDLNQAMGRSCVECDGVFFLTTTGKYHFLAFSSKDFCNRIQEARAKHSSMTCLPLVPPATTCATPMTTTHLQNVRMFLDRCIQETSLTDQERDKMKILVFSRCPKSELERIFSHPMFKQGL
jgi:hypothetical protein